MKVVKSHQHSQRKPNNSKNKKKTPTKKSSTSNYEPMGKKGPRTLPFSEFLDAYLIDVERIWVTLNGLIQAVKILNQNTAAHVRNNTIHNAVDDDIDAAAAADTTAPPTISPDDGINKNKSEADFE